MTPHEEYIKSKLCFICSIIETIKYDANAIAHNLYGDTAEHDKQKLEEITSHKQNLHHTIEQIYQDGYEDGYNERQALGDLEPPKGGNYPH